MITLKPFQAFRPRKGLEAKVACPPYDVLSHKQAAEIGRENPYSLVHITRAEVDMDPAIDPHTMPVYEKERQTLERFIAENIFIQEEKKAYYIYRQIRKGRVQNGIVGCASIDDYEEGRIKRHEFTRVDKEQDRICHFDHCEANTEPVFLFYKKNTGLQQLIDDWTANHPPVYDFVTEDGVTQRLWVVAEEKTVLSIEALFAMTDALYIADGHHRTASAYKVGVKKRQEHPGYTGEEEFNFFLSVVFPGEELLILPYNRMVKDLNGWTEAEFLKEIAAAFEITHMDSAVEPTEKHTFTLLFNGQCYLLRARENCMQEKNVVGTLDAAILQSKLLGPILGIEDPRTDQRIEFIGGDNMLPTIQTRLSQDVKAAFLLYPTEVDDIISVCDAGEVMPPKSTWFEPKLVSGLFLHTF